MGLDGTKFAGLIDEVYLFNRTLTDVEVENLYTNNYFTCHGIAASDPNVCNGRGTCVYPNTCQCQSGYAGCDCEHQIFTCFGINSTSDQVCSGRGRCIAEDTCECRPKCSGINCNLTDAHRDTCIAQSPVYSYWKGEDIFDELETAHFEYLNPGVFIKQGIKGNAFMFSGELIGKFYLFAKLF